MNQLWKDVLEHVRADLGPQLCEAWVEPLRLLDLQDDVAQLEAASDYHVQWIEENKYLPSIEDGFQKVLGRPIRVDLKTGGRAQGDILSPRNESMKRIALDPEKTFDTFVVGSCNEFAHAAAEGVANFPGGRHNPLFLFGGTGLGKTHLVQAIGHAILAANPQARVLYTTAETFVNGVINAIRYKRMDEFRRRHRDEVDVLLIDDIQFLSGKDRCQEEFFHTFQELQNSGRQIVLTSDVLPRNIEKLEPRLRTRFDGGLLADLQAPDIETMVAILHSKADQLQVTLPQDVVYWIASRVRSNIREAEGALKRLVALHSIHGGELDLAFTVKHLGSIYGQPAATLDVEKIVQTVARFYNLKPSDIYGRRRLKGIAMARQIAMYLARQYTDRSFPDLGRAFRRDQSTIQHACKRIREQRAKNPDLEHAILAIEGSLGL